jgi:succinate-semialdehyde dehydrogenase/glutarate-semialdehyde dehydrogenase
MEFKSINPHNGNQIATYTALSNEQLEAKLNNAAKANLTWRNVPLIERTKLLRNAAEVLRQNDEEYAKIITLEMGKPITESRAEVNKCAWVCDYYAENAVAFLADEVIATDARQSFVKHSPIGTVLAIMPWNFPFWQVFRFAAPTLTAGNSALLKHASSVFGCAELIEDVFKNAGYPKDVFQNVIVPHEYTEQIIAHEAVQAVSLTGSERAGSAVAAIAGKYIKKSLLELGGNNAFIVLKDADLNKTINTAVTARMLNCGQSCIAAKRFIIEEDIYEEFVSKFTHEVSQLKSGDPMDESTQIGPLARQDLADQLHTQVMESVKQGAELLLGGKQQNRYYAPTVLGNVTPGMPAFDEETFGPLAAMIKAKNVNHAFDLAGQTKYGLGTTICTTNIPLALEYADRVSDGAYFINELVKSDPRLPFGGTKSSGYGRELGRDGILEFVNQKTVYVNYG